MDWKAAARILFAVMMIAIGIVGLVGGGFAGIWGVVPQTFPDRQLLAYLCAFVSLLCGAGLLARRTAASAAFVLLVYLLVWTACFKFPFIVQAPLVEGSYQTVGENGVLISAAWLLLVESTRVAPNPLFQIAAGDIGTRVAFALYGLALIAFGLSHFFYVGLTAPLVPAWLLAPVFWAYLTGVVYLVTGIGVLSGLGARLAATLAAAQITLITILVWGSIDLAGKVSSDDWQETLISCALTAAASVIAASFAGTPWFAG